MFLDKVILAPYYLTLKIRHAMYDHGFIFKEKGAEVPTICIGNITAGGTGKTPHAEMILRMLFSSHEWGGKNLALLSRGYKRSSKGFQQVPLDGTAASYGDEPILIKKALPVTTVAVDKKRVEGCDFLVHPDHLADSKAGGKCQFKDFAPVDLIVLDDAFQHRALKAYYNIVLVDYNHPINKDRLLPFGRLRDLPERLHHADSIIVTKCPSYMEDYEKTEFVRSLGISKFDPSTCIGVNKKGRKVPVFFTFINYCPLESVYADKADPRYIYSQKLVLFTGIAKDTPLKRYLSDTYKIVRSFNFPDHHKYSGADVSRIVHASKENPTAVVATTQKDAQRVLDSKKVPDNLKERLFQVPIRVFFLSEDEKRIFEDTLLSALRRFGEDKAEGPSPL